MDSLQARVWWAGASLGPAVLTAVVSLAFAGRRSAWLVLLTAASVLVVGAAGFWFLLQRGVLRWLALALAVGAPLAVLVVFVVAQLLWVAVTAAGLLGAAVVAARTALRPDRSAWALSVLDTTPPGRPFVVTGSRPARPPPGRCRARGSCTQLAVRWSTPGAPRPRGGWAAHGLHPTRMTRQPRAPGPVVGGPLPDDTSEAADLVARPPQ